MGNANLTTDPLDIEFHLISGNPRLLVLQKMTSGTRFPGGKDGWETLINPFFNLDIDCSAM
jgi:hypothetical protein